MGIRIFVRKAFTTFGLPILFIVQSSFIWQSAAMPQIKDEESLASALIATQSSVNTRALLKAHKNLLTDNLWDRLNNEVGKSIGSFDYDRCLLLCEVLKQMAEEINDPTRLSYALEQIGAVYLGIGNYLTARERVLEAYSIARSNGNKKRIAGTLATLGRISRILGDYEQATEYLESSLQYAKGLEDKGYQGDALLELSSVYRMTGMYGRAFSASFRALAIFEKSEKLEDKLLLEGVRTSLAILYAEQGDYQKMEQELNQSWQLAKQLDDRQGMVNILQILGIANREQGHIDKALANLQESLALAEETKLPGLIIYSQLPLGSIYQMKGDYDKALHLYNKSLVTAQQIGDRHFVAGALLQIGDWHLSKKNYLKAVELADRASALADKVSLPETSYLAKTIKGKAQFALKELDLAEKSFLEAISIIEDLRTQVSGGEQERQKFFERRVLPYYGMVGLLLEKKNLAGAISYAERAKARVLLDVLRNGRAAINRSMNSKEQQEERRLYTRIVSLNAQVRVERMRETPDEARVAELESTLQQARGAYESFQTAIYADHPELRLKRGLVPAFKIEDAAMVLDDRTAILEYVVTDEAILLFVLTRHSTNRAGININLYKVETDRKGLEDKVRDFRELLAKNQPGFRQPARNLYDLLIKPIEKQVEGKSSLCIIPDGPLWELPFQALLTVENKYLLERHAIYYTPSIQVLAEIRKRAASLQSSPISMRSRSESGEASQLYAIGNPMLNREVLSQNEMLRNREFAEIPEAEREVQALAQLYGARATTIHIGAMVKEETIKAEIGKYRVIHFATHGVLENHSPLYSYLIVGTGNNGKEDGFLEAWELMNMELKAEMAVLSACNMARGHVRAGEGLIGMTWAFFVGGVPTTVASQWEVPEASTTDLMVAFHKYRNGVNGGEAKKSPKAQAWREAALQMITNPRYRMKPYYWAGFVVVGDGGV